jgi:8-oxo-dGTP pyrophosphatase MutT (NUDIX family)
MADPAAPHTATIRDAATVLVMREGPGGPAILMGQRGAGAAFMPSKYVFPGGAVDAGDAAVPLASGLGAACAARLGQAPRRDAAPVTAAALAAAAIRELWEETGLMLAAAGPWAGPAPAPWDAFAARGMLPAAAPLRFVFRAITPPGRPRRFDARFFLADAAAIAGDPDDFGHATDELSHLHWVPLAEARALNLPFITEVVLAEVAARRAEAGPPPSVPFFDNAGTVPTFRRLA